MLNYDTENIVNEKALQNGGCVLRGIVGICPSIVDHVCLAAVERSNGCIVKHLCR